MDSGYKFRNPEGIYFVTFAVVEWVDLFSRKYYVQIVLDSLAYCIKNKGLRLHAYCILTNHLHLIISAKTGQNLADILRDLKKFTSRQLIQAIEQNKAESRRNWMLWIFKAAARKNARNSSYQLWRQNNQPKELVTNHFMQEKLNYVHNNPVAAGYVYQPEDWCWSSARAYSGELSELPLCFIE